jgi:hypothetical protein
MLGTAADRVLPGLRTDIVKYLEGQDLAMRTVPQDTRLFVRPRSSTARTAARHRWRARHRALRWDARPARARRRSQTPPAYQPRINVSSKRASWQDTRHSRMPGRLDLPTTSAS